MTTRTEAVKAYRSTFKTAFATHCKLKTAARNSSKTLGNARRAVAVVPV